MTLALRTVSAFWAVAFSTTGLMFNTYDLAVGLVGGTSLLALAECIDIQTQFAPRKKRLAV